jgi:hypothetical protein
MEVESAASGIDSLHFSTNPAIRPRSRCNTHPRGVVYIGYDRVLPSLSCPVAARHACLVPCRRIDLQSLRADIVMSRLLATAGRVAPSVLSVRFTSHPVFSGKRTIP